MNASYSPAIGQTIKYLRTETGMRQGELAARINKTQTIVSCIESGKSRPSLSTVKEICKVFKIKPSAFFRMAIASADNEKVIDFIFNFFKR